MLRDFYLQTWITPMQCKDLNTAIICEKSEICTKRKYSSQIYPATFSQRKCQEIENFGGKRKADEHLPFVILIRKLR